MNDVGETMEKLTMMSNRLFLLCMIFASGQLHANVTIAKGDEATDSPMQPPTQRTASDADIPVVYYETIGDERLTKFQVERLVHVVREVVAPERTVWFIRCYACFPSFAVARVYLRPDTMEARLRKGFYTSVQLTRETVQRPFPSEKLELHPYVQVSLPDRPFGDDLETPTTYELPFARPTFVAPERNRRGLSTNQQAISTPNASPLEHAEFDGTISDKDIVRVVDAVRTAHANYRKDVLAMIKPVGSRGERDAPENKRMAVDRIAASQRPIERLSLKSGHSCEADLGYPFQGERFSVSYDDAAVTVDRNVSMYGATVYLGGFPVYCPADGENDED